MGFRDKIKRMLESDNPPRGKQQEKVIEQNNVKFLLTGGPIHTELLVVEAFLGEKAEKDGMPLPIVCKWFNKNSLGEIVEIEGVTGAFYQPNADDVNTTIIVEAIPIIEDGEYKGDAIHREVGPLSLDKEIQNKAQEILESGRFSTQVRVEFASEDGANISPDEGNMQCEFLVSPSELVLRFQEDGTTTDEDKCTLEGVYPSIRIVKKSNVLFDLCFSSNRFYRIQANSNTHRDIITVALRMFAGKQLMMKIDNQESFHKNIKQENCEIIQEVERKKSEGKIKKQHQAEQSFELFVIISDLKKRTIELEDKMQLLNEKYEEVRAGKIIAEENISSQVKRIEELNEEIEQQNALIQVLRGKHAQYMDEKLFLKQEVQSLQEERDVQESELQEYEQTLTESKPHEKLISTGISVDEISRMQQIIEKLSEQTLSNTKSVDELKAALEDKESSLQTVETERDVLLGEVNYLKMKYNSLVQEKTAGKTKSDETQKEKDISQEPNQIKILDVLSCNSSECEPYSEGKKVQSSNSVISEKSKEGSQFDVSNNINTRGSLSINVQSQQTLQDIIILKEQLALKIMTNNELNWKILQLETTLETVSKAYTQDVKAINSVSKLKAKEGGNEQILQKLINRLTEMLTDKDEALENQRMVNRDLAKKLETALDKIPQ